MRWGGGNDALGTPDVLVWKPTRRSSRFGLVGQLMHRQRAEQVQYQAKACQEPRTPPRPTFYLCVAVSQMSRKCFDVCQSASIWRLYRLSPCR